MHPLVTARVSLCQRPQWSLPLSKRGLVDTGTDKRYVQRTRKAPRSPGRCQPMPVMTPSKMRSQAMATRAIASPERNAGEARHLQRQRHQRLPRPAASLARQCFHPARGSGCLCRTDPWDEPKRFGCCSGGTHLCLLEAFSHRLHSGRRAPPRLFLAKSGAA